MNANLFFRLFDTSDNPNRLAIEMLDGTHISYGDLIARAGQDDVKQRLIDNTANAVARGAFGSPTFFVGDEIFFGKDRLRDVEEMILASR